MYSVEKKVYIKSIYKIKAAERCAMNSIRVSKVADVEGFSEAGVQRGRCVEGRMVESGGVQKREWPS